MDEDNTEIDYWLEKTSKIKEDISGMRDILLLIHNSVDFKDMTDFLNKLPTDKISYISVTKTYDSLKPYFEKVKKEIYVVDCVSKVLFRRDDTEECIFISPPGTLYQLTSIIKEEAKKRQSTIVIDSLSQFVSITTPTEEQESIYLFSGNVKEILKDNYCKVVLLYDSDISKPLRNLPKVHIDRIIKMEVSKDVISWQG
jgi:hypothetical protein